MKKKTNKSKITQDDYVKAMKKVNREIELEKNGGRWISVTRPHKNKKTYDRKQNKKELSKMLDGSSFLHILYLIDAINR